MGYSHFPTSNQMSTLGRDIGVGRVTLPMAVLSDFESEEEEDLYLMEENPKENLDVTSRGCFSRGFA